MAKPAKASAQEAQVIAQDIGQLVVRDPRDLLLTLKPAELEALILRMYACSTRRVRCSAPRHPVRCCAGGSAGTWCRLGVHAAAGYIDTKLG